MKLLIIFSLLIANTLSTDINQHNYAKIWIRNKNYDECLIGIPTSFSFDFMPENSTMPIDIYLSATDNTHLNSWIATLPLDK